MTGAVLVDLSAEPGVLDEGADRRALQEIFNCPPGALVRVHVGRRRHFSDDVYRILHHHATLLDIEICSPDPRIVTALVRAVRWGNQWEVA